MQSEKTINERVLKLTGKVNIPEDLEVGHNWKILIDGSITSEELKDKNNGAFDKIFKFEPVLVEAISAKGKRIKAKDPRKMSQKLRGAIFHNWDGQGEFDDFYEKRMGEIIGREMNN